MAGTQPAELGGDLGGPDARRVEQRATADERHRGAAGGGGRAAAVRDEPGALDALPADADRHADLIAAGGAAGGDGEAVIRESPESLRRGQVVFEGERVHAREDSAAAGARRER